MTHLPSPNQGQAIRRVQTRSRDPVAAAEALEAGLKQDHLSLVMLFIAPPLATDALAAEISRRFSGISVIGCTTAGEIGPDGYQQDSIVGVSFAAPDFHAATRVIEDIRSFSVGDGRGVAQACIEDAEARSAGLPGFHSFATLLIDGLDACEETVVSGLHRELGEIPLFGGSAGDGLEFGRTRILADGRFIEHGAALAVIATRRPFRVFKTEHFAGTSTKMVVTEADPGRRIVTEINAEPAAEEYARMVGVDLGADRLTPMVFANHPVVVRIGAVPYVRSIQKVNKDGSLTFYCAIDEGIVLTAAQGLDIEKDLLRQFDSLREALGPLDIVIGCDCILRRLEIREKGLDERISAILSENNAVGFNTYGEQYLAMHVNQTFTGVAIGRSA